MRTNLKNITLAATILLSACKSNPNAQKITQNAVDIASHSISADLAGFNHKNPFSVLPAPFSVLQRLEAQKALNDIKMPKPKKSLDISKTRYKGSPKFLDMFLTGVLKGKGKQFCKAQEKYGVNATFLVGIANLESGRGLSDVAKTHNNIAGMKTSKGYLKYKTVDDCIDSLAANIKENYINEGYTTIGKINKKYSECDEWGDRVVNCMNDMYHSSKSILFNFK